MDGAFVLGELPPPPARVLEIGCGAGKLALDVAETGYEVLAIDPDAPEGAIFRQTTLEKLDETGTFDAVVASRSLHHIDDLEAAIERIHGLVRPSGRLILVEFAWERMDPDTADWYLGQQLALQAPGRLEDVPRSVEEALAAWDDEHRGLHSAEAMRVSLSRRFHELRFERTPYLHRMLGGVASEALEQTLVDAGAIRALGLRWVGEPRMVGR
ncbi:MAG TPA: class I SAM-dependent methyltransferase [Gaiellaceae bacterium]|nr:class I SAM-dependent methyltransferase [Gaiellaceae bacterium]